MKGIQTQIIRRFLTGVFMGIAGLIPGVSSGTIAVVAGVYRDLIEAISHMTTRQRKLHHFLFLINLFSGMIIATLLFARFIEYLISVYPSQLNLFLIGLIIGTIPSLSKSAFDEKPRVNDLVIILLTLILVLALQHVSPVPAEPILVLSMQTAVMVFLAGFLAGGAGLIPGVSGSTILLMIGMYATLITAIRGFNWPILLLLTAGVLIGFVIFTRGIHYLLQYHSRFTYQAIIGLILGAAVNLWPGKVMQNEAALVQVFVLILGVAAAYLSYRVVKDKHV